MGRRGADAHGALHAHARQRCRAGQPAVGHSGAAVRAARGVDGALPGAGACTRQCACAWICVRKRVPVHVCVRTCRVIGWSTCEWNCVCVCVCVCVCGCVLVAWDMKGAHPWCACVRTRASLHAYAHEHGEEQPDL